MPGTEFPTSQSSTYPASRIRKPLIEYCTNEWRNIPTCELPLSQTRIGGDHFLDRLILFVDRCTAVIRAPKFRRLLLLIFLGATLSAFLWIKIIRPFLDEERAAWSAFNLNSNPATGGVFGANVRPQFPDMIHVKTLDPNLLPRSPKEKKEGIPCKQRLVFVGDIHGCRKELEALLKKLHFDPSTDHLIALGDVVSKGPDSLGVIDLLRRYEASCVRGNHEDRLLLVTEDLQSTSLGSQKNSKFNGNSNEQKLLGDQEAERELAMSLNRDQLEYLKSCPVILRLGEVKAFNGEAVVVHAGLVPGIPLESQDPVSVMNMRIVDLTSHLPSKMHDREGSVPWYKLWNKYQRLLPAQQRLVQFRHKDGWSSEKQTTVIYGHDAKTGLQIHKYTKGLDTGCVRGGQLTALVVDHTGKQKIVRVDCKSNRQRHRVQDNVKDILGNGKSAPPTTEENN